MSPGVDLAGLGRLETYAMAIRQGEGDGHISGSGRPVLIDMSVVAVKKS